MMPIPSSGSLRPAIDSHCFTPRYSLGLLMSAPPQALTLSQLLRTPRFNLRPSTVQSERSRPIWPKTARLVFSTCDATEAAGTPNGEKAVNVLPCGPVDLSLL